MDDVTDFPPIYVTVDVVVLTIRDDQLQALVIKRRSAPYKGKRTLPGGFFRQSEGLDEAARRELREKTGIDIAPLHLGQLGAYGKPQRDPRFRTVSVAYLAILPKLSEPQAGSDAATAQWMPVDQLSSRRLAFDHDEILADALDRVRAKLEYSPLAAAFCDPTFTIADLRRVYEIVWGRELDPSNFHRKVSSAEGFLVPTRQTRSLGRGRPARLFRPGKAQLLHPAILR